MICQPERAGFFHFMAFFTYILYSPSSDKYYIGSSGDLNGRLQRHNQGRSKATKYGIHWKLVYQNQDQQYLTLNDNSLAEN